MEALAFRERSGAACPLCREEVGAGAVLGAELGPGSGGEAQACAGCGTVYHASCFAELGGCATLGCAQESSGLGGRARGAPGWTRVARPEERVVGVAERALAEERARGWQAMSTAWRVLWGISSLTILGIAAAAVYGVRLLEEDVPRAVTLPSLAILVFALYGAWKACSDPRHRAHPDRRRRW